MLRKTFYLLFLFFPNVLMAQSNAQDSAWIRDNYTKTELYITMREWRKAFYYDICPQ